MPGGTFSAVRFRRRGFRVHSGRRGGLSCAVHTLIR
nr:MAG TPA: hypothetical protein [Caudoviricetes sp.]